MTVIGFASEPSRAVPIVSARIGIAAVGRGKLPPEMLACQSPVNVPAVARDEGDAKTFGERRGRYEVSVRPPSAIRTPDAEGMGRVELIVRHRQGTEDRTKKVVRCAADVIELVDRRLRGTIVKHTGLRVADWMNMLRLAVGGLCGSFPAWR